MQGDFWRDRDIKQMLLIRTIFNPDPEIVCVKFARTRPWLIHPPKKILFEGKLN
jgi:hypothetical protein